jgi:hypothetical protein
MKDDLLMSYYILSEEVQDKLQNKALTIKEQADLIKSRQLLEELMKERLYFIELSEKIEEGKRIREGGGNKLDNARFR